jgi:hypothetical protein
MSPDNFAPFFGLTSDQMALLDEQGLADAIKLEAMTRGILIPVTLKEAIQTSGFTGYMASPEDQHFYCVKGPEYGDTVGYLTEDAAKSALEGSAVFRDTYVGGGSRKVLADRQPTIERVTIPGRKFALSVKALEPYFNDADSEEFAKLQKECITAYEANNRDRYNAAAAKERKQEYIRLAGGDTEIAKAFWLKTERLEWPAD